MKRFAAFFAALCLLLVASVCAAEGTDFASMSDDALHALVDGARNELAKRERAMAENTVLFEQDGVTVYLTGKYEISNRSDGAVMELEAVVVNDSAQGVGVYMDECAVNGWETAPIGIITGIGSGKKKKDELDIRLYEADVSAYEEITDIDFKFYVADAETFKTLFKMEEPVTIHFNAE